MDTLPSRTPRIWKISPGEGAWQWPDCQRGNFIALSWDELGDVSRLTREGFDALRDRLAMELDWGKGGANQVWQFAHEIHPGDIIVANKGKRIALGFGEVQGPYYYEQGADHSHRLPVHWYDTQAREIDEPSWSSTLIPLSDEKLRQLVDSPPAPAAQDSLIPGLGQRSAWGICILRTLEQRNGSAPPAEVKKHVHELAERQLSPETMELVKGKRVVGWTKHSLKTRGYLNITNGTWVLTDLGRELLNSTRDVQVELNYSPRDASNEPDDRPVQTVLATASAGYTRPVLEVMLHNGSLTMNQFYEKLFPLVEQHLLPGDRGYARNGFEVWQNRAWRALVQLKQQGLVEQPGPRLWAITAAGKAAFTSEGAENWQLSNYQGDSKAQVLLETDEVEEEPAAPEVTWKLSSPIPDDLATELARYLRLDLGPTVSLPVPVARNVIFYGPPGTGKTYLARAVAQQLCPEDEESRQLVQFHPSYSYEDFVQGIRPSLSADTLKYELHRGPFARLCDRAEEHPDQFHVLIIDEINRADPARVFGELLFALEYRDSEVTLPGGSTLCVPQNVIVIGTMNSVDRSVALVDYALRRRFGFFRVDPEPSVILRHHGSGAHAGVEALRRLNAHLTQHLGPDHAIGHSFFLKPSYPTMDSDNCERLWTHEIEPLLHEYFFEQPERVQLAREVWRNSFSASAP